MVECANGAASAFVERHYSRDHQCRAHHPQARLCRDRLLRRRRPRHQHNICTSIGANAWTAAAARVAGATWAGIRSSASEGAGACLWTRTPPACSRGGSDIAGNASRRHACLLCRDRRPPRLRLTPNPGWRVTFPSWRRVQRLWRTRRLPLNQDSPGNGGSGLPRM